MKHTPAPWTPSFYIDHDPSDGPVITGFSINGPNDESVIWYSEYSSVQNARDLSLITAASNLLAACQEALQTLEREGGYGDLQAVFPVTWTRRPPPSHHLRLRVSGRIAVVVS